MGLDRHMARDTCSQMGIGLDGHRGRQSGWNGYSERIPKSRRLSYNAGCSNLTLYGRSVPS